MAAQCWVSKLCSAAETIAPGGESVGMPEKNRAETSAPQPLLAGKYCGHGVELSWPLLPAPMQNFSAAFEGEFILHRGIVSSQLKVRMRVWLVCGVRNGYHKY